MPEEKAKVSPSIFQSILLDEIAQGIRQVKNIMNQTIPDGVISSYTEIITDKPREFRPYKPWFSVTVYNRGPKPVHVGVNVGHGGGIKIESGDSFPVNLSARKIRFLKLWCDANQTTNVKVITIS